MTSVKSSWRPTAAHLRCVATAVALAIGAVLLGRSDLFVLAVPLAVAAVWGAASRPRQAPQVQAAVGHSSLREGEATPWRVRVEHAHEADRVCVALAESPSWRLHPARGRRVVAVPTDSSEDGAVETDIVVTSVRWGRRDIGPGAVSLESAWGAYRAGPVLTKAPTIITLPLPAVFDATAPVPDARGLVGAHRSSRRGDGAEFAAIRPFAVGDRLRRIHWPVSLRTGTLHVSASTVDVDTQVVVVVDASTDIGEQGPYDEAASSLDRSVRAAGAIAEHFVRRGDRVGVRAVGAARSIHLPVSGGQSQLRRLLHELALVEPGRWLQRTGRPRPLGVDPGGLVVVLTPLLSEVVIEQIAYLAQRHATVLVVDTLPPDIAAQQIESATALAWRVRLLERRRDERRIQSVGVPVVPWRGPGSLDVILRDLGQRSHAPRQVRR